jgi:hypothetical protein
MHGDTHLLFPDGPAEARQRRREIVPPLEAVHRMRAERHNVAADPVEPDVEGDVVGKHALEVREVLRDQRAQAGGRRVPQPTRAIGRRIDRQRDRHIA